MTEALTKKRRIRAGHKASATKTIRNIEDLLSSSAPDKARLSLLQLTLKEKLETIKTLDSEVVELIDDEGLLADEIEQADSYRETAFAALIRINQSSVTPPVATGVHAPIAPSDPRSSRVKLLKLQLRSFGGDLTKWVSFWESFESAVHDNKDLSDIEKFNYLSSLLERSAREAIAGLALTSTNYHQAIDTLKRRFGSKQQIVNKHVDTLLQLEGVTSSQNTRALRRLFDNISSHVRSLRSLGVGSDAYGTVLCPVLLAKLPADLQLIISRKVSESDWNLDPLMEAVEEEITARERIGGSQVRHPTRKNDSKPPPTATALMSGDGPGVTTPCCYCNQLHAHSSCNTVTDVETRRQTLLKKGRCFSCLRRGHLSRDCPSRSRCRTCNGRHHTSICHRSSAPTGHDQQSQHSQPPNSISGTSMISGTQTTPTMNVDHPSTLNPGAPAFTSPPTSTSLYMDSNKAVLLQTALVEVSNPLRPASVLKLRLVMDSGSQRSYLTQRVKDALGLEACETQSLSIAAFGSQRREPKQCEVVRLNVCTKLGTNQRLELFVVPHICDPLMHQPVSMSSKKYSHLSQLDLADPSSGEMLEVDLLIGSDFYWEFMTGETIRGQSGPVAVKTTLGWVLSGPVETTGHLKSTASLITTHTLRAEGVTNQELNTTLKTFWDLESLGILERGDPVLDHFTSTIQMKCRRYEVALPWREHHSPLPDNYDLSYQRLHGLLRRLKQKPAILQEYDSIIRDQLSKGIVEQVKDLKEDPEVPVHYLPHHAVIRQDKETTKLRVVYDASARSSGPSLNDCLHTGPKFNQKILLRFRSYPIALVADIEKAFLMISIAPEDRNVLRFLWLSDAFHSEPEVVIMRFTRVVFGVSASPFLLNATIKHHLEKYLSSHPDLVTALMQSIYVDDLVCGANSEEEAYVLYADSKEILSHGSFNLRKFVSNSQLLQKRINDQEASSRLIQSSKTPVNPAGIEVSEETFVEATLPTNQSGGPGEQKVLGVRWEVSRDQLTFDLSGVAAMAKNLDPTKRNVISIIGQIYDPLGFLSPVTIMLKMLMQESFKGEIAWDQRLQGELLTKWQNIIDDLMDSLPITLPRCYMMSTGEGSCVYRLYGFCDASLSAYAAVIYLVAETENNKYSSFVVAKTRVSPLKTQTIPRLELLSALLLARLMSNVTYSLTPRLALEEPICFTDSQVALFWIQGTGRDWKPFVQNRVNEICRLVPLEYWRHCSGKENPADIPSRGMTPHGLSVSSLWRSGPEWLKGTIDRQSLPEEAPQPCVAEMKAGAVHNLLTTPPRSISHLIDCECFSTTHRLYRVTAYVLKFLRILRKEVQSPELTVQDLTEAERMWILESQSSMMEDKNFPMWKVQFGLFKDDDQIWRCGGRLHNADLPFSAKHPVLLNKKHYFTSLIVRNAHQRVQHNGVKETLTEIRARYWIIGGRSLVRLLIHRCVVCKRFEGKPLNPPPAPPLPSFRVNEAPPFAYTAVDFAGPLYLRTKEAGSKKVWICLFTCCVTRAIHLELVLDMSTMTFIRTLKRFSARRGLPRRMLSDNAKTFKAAAKTIKIIFNHQAVKDYLSQVRVEWSFNLEKAPWWGGLFERMVKSTKRCLRKLVGQAKFSFDEMHTAIVEIEGIINSRPLSYMNADDVEEPLTPSHLLTGRRILSLPDNLTCFDIEDEDFEVTDESLQRRAKHLNRVLNHFWKRWSKEYLLELRDSHRQKQASGNSASVRVGDVVVVHDQDNPRGFWKLAKIEKLLSGKDGLVRGAVLRLPSKNGHSSTLRRPIQLLYPLISHVGFEPAPVTEPSAKEGEASIEVTGDTSSHVRPRRASALKARERCKKWSMEILEQSS
jgi:hypothetical protein